jgi:hypothetical protein
MEIAIDFDGTCVSHEYPKIGKDIGAVSVLKRLMESGNQLILFTMRSGKELQEAVDWFADNDLILYGIGYNPTQREWSKSNKCYAQLYIDDAALGCPLIYSSLEERPFVDWESVKMILIEKGIIV